MSDDDDDFISDLIGDLVDTFLQILPSSPIFVRLFFLVVTFFFIFLFFHYYSTL